MNAHKNAQTVGNQQDGGEGGIRTHGSCYTTPDFESGAIDHSTTSPGTLGCGRRKLIQGRGVVKRAIFRSIGEDDGAVAVDDGAVLDVVADALGDGVALAVAAEADEVGGGVEVMHAFDFLLDDGPGIEIGGDVVAGGADEFDAALVGLLVGIGADEGGQETVVDVDDAPGVVVAQIIRQDLHEAREHDEFHVLRLDQAADGGEAGGALVAVHRDLMERDAGMVGDAAAVRPVADDGGDFHRELAEFGAPEDFVEAVVRFGDEHGGAHAVRQAAEVPAGLQRTAERAETVDKILHIDREFGGLDFEAGEKLRAKLVGELVELDEVAAMHRAVTGDLGDDAGLVRTGEFEDETRAGHGRRRCAVRRVPSISGESVPQVGPAQPGPPGVIARIFRDAHTRTRVIRVAGDRTRQQGEYHRILHEIAIIAPLWCGFIRRRGSG
jgi:hypothetical protein